MIACLRSETPEVTALKFMNFALVDCANMLASVVLPLPGGPHKISDGKVPFPTLLRRGLSGPIISDWPTNSSKVSGRILEASGDVSFSRFLAL